MINQDIFSVNCVHLHDWLQRHYSHHSISLTIIHFGNLISIFITQNIHTYNTDMKIYICTLILKSNCHQYISFQNIIRNGSINCCKKGKLEKPSIDIKPAYLSVA